MSEKVSHTNRINRVGIVGEGKMGTGIFYYLVNFGFDLVWLCSPEADTEKLNRQFGKKIKRSLDSGMIDRQQYDRLLLTPITSNINSLSGCDLVIEAIPEVLEQKKKLFLQLDECVKPDAVFTSNSSSLNPSEIVPPGQRTNLFAGLHFFYPVQLKNIIEFTITDETSDQAILLIELFLKDINRRFITLNENNSFILNKIFLDFQNEAFRIVQAGHCTFIQMDQMVKRHLLEFGVFDFCDSVGIDTMLASIENYTRNYPHKDYYAPMLSALRNLASEGKLGIKTQQGFYTYPIPSDVIEEPDGSPEIMEHLRQTFYSSSKRFTALSHLPIGDMNWAIKEYFGIEKGPFE